MKLKRNQLNYIRPICPFSSLQATNVCSHMSVSSKPIHPSTFKVDSLQEVCMSTASHAMAQHPNLHASSACAIEYVCQLLPLPYTCAQEKSTVCVACHCIVTHDRCDTSCARRSALLLAVGQHMRKIT